MATKKPRVLVTLDPDDYAIIDGMAELNGQSRSSIVAGLVHSAAPMLENVLEAGRAFVAAKGALNEDVRGAFEEADQVLGPEIAGLQADIIDRLQEIRLLASIPDDDAEDPRPVIRGSATPTPHLHPVRKEEEK